MKKSILLVFLTTITAINFSCHSDNHKKSLSEVAREQSISQTKETLIKELENYNEMISYFHLSIDEWIKQYPEELPTGKPSSIAMHIDSSTIRAKIEESISSTYLIQKIGDDYSRFSINREILPNWWENSRIFITDRNSFITSFNYEKIFFHNNTTEDFKCSVFGHPEIKSTKPVDSIMASVTCMLPTKIIEVEIKRGDPLHHFHNGTIYLDASGSLFITQSLFTSSCGIYALNNSNQIIAPSEAVTFEGLDVLISNYKKIQSIIQNIEVDKYNNREELAKDIETLTEGFSMGKSLDILNPNKPDVIYNINWNEKDSVSRIVLLTGAEYFKKEYKINIKNNTISNLGYHYISEASQPVGTSGLYVKMAGSDGTIVLNKYLPEANDIEQYTPYFFRINDSCYIFDESTLDLKPIPYKIEEAINLNLAIVSQTYETEYHNYIKMYGVLDKSGELVTPIEFTNINIKGKTLLYCKKYKEYSIDHQKRTISISINTEHNYSVINLKGESLLPEGLEVSYGIEFDEETIFFPEYYDYDNYHYQVFNSNGTPFLENGIVSGMYYWLNGILQVWDHSSNYFIDKQKNKVLDVSKYDSLSVYPCGYIIVKDKNKHMGLFDTNGKLRLPFDYTFISEPTLNISLVIKETPEGKQCALVNMNNEPLIPFKPYQNHDIEGYDYSRVYTINDKKYNVFSGIINQYKQ